MPVLESTGAEALWFVVSPQNPFKAGKELAPETDRIEMARIALQSAVHSDRMAVSDIEFRLPKPNRTIRTLEKLRTEYPGRKFSLLIGSDNMAGFPKWMHSQEILDRYRVLVYPRPGYPTPGIRPVGRLYDLNESQRTAAGGDRRPDTDRAGRKSRNGAARRRVGIYQKTPALWIFRRN